MKSQTNPAFITKIQECLIVYQNIMEQINFTKHPAERELCIQQINAILSTAAERANEEVLEYLSKYITFNYMSPLKCDAGIWDTSEE